MSGSTFSFHSVELRHLCIHGFFLCSLDSDYGQNPCKSPLLIPVLTAVAGFKQARLAGTVVPENLEGP